MVIGHSVPRRSALTLWRGPAWCAEVGATPAGRCYAWAVAVVGEVEHG
jgi:hypothetical protein